MNAIRGRVRGGHVELDSALPDGTEVVVLVPADEAPFKLDDASNDELASRMDELDRDETEPAEVLFKRLRPAR
jgi:hypothetical protein